MQFSKQILERTGVRILAIALGIIALFLVFLFAVIFPVVQDSLFDSRKMASKNLVDSVHGMIQDYQKRVEDGEMTEPQAKQAAKERIRSMRFADNGYIWINDTTRPYPRMILHPAMPSLEGRIMDEPVYRTATAVELGMDGPEVRFDGNKRHFFKVFLEVAEDDGSGFVHYRWRRPTPGGTTEEMYPKISYVRLFAPWQWIIGTGVYVGDVYAHMARLKWTIISMAAALLLIALAGTFLLMRTVTRPIQRLVGYAEQVAEGNTRAEIRGRFKGEMQQLKEAISQMVHELRTRAREAELRAREAENARRQLKNIQQRFELAVRGTNDGIWDWQPDTDEVYFSRRWKEIIGYEDHELPNRIEEWQKRIHPEDYERVMKANRVFYETDADQFELEYRLQHKDGSYRWILGRAACLRDENRRPVRLAGAHTDITEKKEAEQTLRQSEEKYRLVFENAPLGVLHFDQNGAITACNNNMVEIIGSTRDALVGLNMLELPDQGVVEAVKAALAGQQGFYEGLYESVTANKATPARVLFAPFTDSTGSILGGVGMIEDITERKKAEDALRQSEEKYRVLVENAREAIFVAQDGMLPFANAATCELTGASLEEVISVPFTHFLHPEDRQLVLDRHEKRMQGLDPVSDYRFRLVHRDGSVKWVELKAILIEWEGRPATLNFMSDVTEQQRAQEEREELEKRLRQAQKIEALGTLTGGVAHDFNNILSIILGYTELVQGEMTDLPEDHPASKGLRQISAAGIRARDVVRQLLTFSRQGEEEKSAQNIGLIVKEGMRMMHSTTPSFIDIDEQIQTNLPMVMANPTQIHQLIINLCKNASDAMADKGGTLAVGLEPVTLKEQTPAFGFDLVPGDYVKLTVGDTGQGIDKDSLERIFDPYYTTKEVDKGTGLGLSVVLGIVRDLGGGIRVKSENHLGSRFEVYFPVLAEPAEAPSPGPREATPGGSERILFVDDEPPVTQLNELRLQRLGYRVVCETDPERALDGFARDPDGFDLVITDMTMPTMTGDVFAREIRKVRPEMKIILCTGYSEKISAETARQSGIDRYLEKPVDLSKLADTVRGLLDD